MTEQMLDDEIRYRLLCLLERRPEVSQRELAGELGISIGKEDVPGPLHTTPPEEKGHMESSKASLEFSELVFLPPYSPELNAMDCA